MKKKHAYALAALGLLLFNLVPLYGLWLGVDKDSMNFLSIFTLTGTAVFLICGAMDQLASAVQDSTDEDGHE